MFAFVRAGGIAAAVFALGASAIVGSPTVAVSVPNPQMTAGFQDHLAADVAPVTAVAEQNALPVQIENAPAQAGEAEAAAAPAPVAAVAEPETVATVRNADLDELPGLVAEHRGTAAGSRELECLATAIYYESKSESLAGQLAVGQVIRNRAESGRFPRSLCGVVLQRSQFSFVRGGQLPSVPKGSQQWKTAVAVAKIVADDMVEDVVPRALFFHARHVSPGWKLKRISSVGNHVFYR